MSTVKEVYYTYLFNSPFIKHRVNFRVFYSYIKILDKIKSKTTFFAQTIIQYLKVAIALQYKQNIICNFLALITC